MFYLKNILNEIEIGPLFYVDGAMDWQKKKIKMFKMLLLDPETVTTNTQI